MEQKFSVEYSASRKLYNEFGYIHVKRQKTWGVILVCVIILMALSVFFMVLKGTLDLKILLPAVLFYLYWLFADLYTGTLSYNAANKTTRGNPARMIFTETEQISETPTASSRVAYTSFLDVYESDELFALYTSKTSALLVPKAGFTEGTVDDFREFISQKIGPVRRVQRSAKRRILGIVLGVCFALAMVGGLFFFRYWNDRLVPYENEQYSISLPSAFKQYEDEDYTFAAKTNDVCVTAFADTKQAFLDNGITDVDTIADYADLFKYVFEIDHCETKTLANGTICLTYTQEYDTDMIFYCDALTEADDAFWCTEFYCWADAQAKYEPLFYEWAETIQIAD